MNIINEKSVKRLIKEKSRKGLLYTFEEAMVETLNRKMINSISFKKNKTEKIRQKLIDTEFLIKEGNNLIISGGGRVCLFLILNSGSIYDEIKRVIKGGNIESFKQVLYFAKKLDYFKLKLDSFDERKLLDDNYGGKK